MREADPIPSSSSELAGVGDQFRDQVFGRLDPSEPLWQLAVEPAAKLRGDRGIWPTVAELMAGRSVSRVFDGDLALELDSGASASGPNADFRLKAHDMDSGISIEFKAVGLSHSEVEFFERMAPLLPDLCPESGVLTSHIAFDNPRSPISRAEPSSERRGARIGGARKGCPRTPEIFMGRSSPPTTPSATT